MRAHRAQRTSGPRWPHEAPSDGWLEECKGARKVDEEKKARAALLAADEAEVRDNAKADVPETIVDLLEEQVHEIKRKAPKGVIAALAAARLDARGHAKRIAEGVQGLAALEKAASAH